MRGVRKVFVLKALGLRGCYGRERGKRGASKSWHKTSSASLIGLNDANMQKLLSHRHNSSPAGIDKAWHKRVRRTLHGRRAAAH